MNEPEEVRIVLIPGIKLLDDGGRLIRLQYGHTLGGRPSSVASDLGPVCEMEVRPLSVRVEEPR